MAKQTVLVVDDEHNFIELARLYLEQEGFAVEEAPDGLKLWRRSER
jgi:CheY-like chemotaxis protein